MKKWFFKNRVWLMTGIGIAVMTFALGYQVGIRIGKRWEGYKINRVVDGDTLGVTDLRTGRDWRMRLWGIDAPEAKECGAKESKEELEKIVGGTNPKISILGVDGFGRYIGRLWVVDAEVVKTIVADGWARVDISTESVYDDLKPSLGDVGELRRLEEKAKELNLGIWGELCR